MKRVQYGESESKRVRLNLFDKMQDGQRDDFSLDYGSPKICVNFLTKNNKLENGYGFSVFKQPTSEDGQETDYTIRGTEVKALYPFKWYDSQSGKNVYVLYYFNNEKNLCFDNLFGERPATFIHPTTFTDIPAGCPYVVDGQDAMIFSGEGDALYVVTGSYEEEVDSAPVLLSVCTHYDKLFAITAGARRSLVYTENLDILTWNNEETSHLSFSDSLGNLNKIISFNDYLYLFRDFGITRVSSYSSESDFSVSHLYQADGYIFPGSIAQGGDKVYFLEKSGLKEFNGSSVKDIAPLTKELFEGQENKYCSGACFEGKYYLACKLSLDQSSGENNALLVYDSQSEDVTICTGMNIKQLQVLPNPIKSKLIACFYGTHKDKIGQISQDGKLFGQDLEKLWQSAWTDFGENGMKKIVLLSLLTKFDCTVTISSDVEEKSFFLHGSDKVQEKNICVLGKVFQISIVSNGQADISNVQLEFKSNK